MNICIFGAANDQIDLIFFSELKALCTELATAGHGLVFGAGTHGMMGTAARTFKENGATEIIGVAPGFFNQPGVLYEGCSELIITDTMRHRKQIMDERSDAFIAVPGGVGTLEEMFEIITLRQLEQTNKPVIIYNIDHYFDPILAFIEGMKIKGFMRKTNTRDLFYVCTTPAQVMEILNK